MSVSSRPAARTLPRYYVSARHGRIVRVGLDAGNWQPFGNHHARQVGSPTTACGLAAHDWRMFWELPFPSHREATCQECIALVAPLEQQSRRAIDVAGGSR